MSEFSRYSARERHAQRQASRRIANLERRRVTGPGNLPPGSVQNAQVGLRQLSAHEVLFGGGNLAFLQTQTANFTVSADVTGWTKPGGGGGGDDLRLRIGQMENPQYAWVFAALGWNNGQSTGFHGRMCVALYKDDVVTRPAYKRSENVQSNWMPSNSNFRSFYLNTRILIPSSTEILNADGEWADWHIGMQVNCDGASGFTTQTINRQSLVVFLSAAPHTEPDLADTGTGSGFLGRIGGDTDPAPGTTDAGLLS